MSKSADLHIRIPFEVLRDLRQAAQGERRSLNNLIVGLLQNSIKSREEVK